MKIALVGLDLVGTSLGLALKATSDAFEIVGHDPDEARIKRARKLKAVDRTHWNLLSACEGAELVLLDLPYGELDKIFAALGQGLEGSPVVIDTTAVKRPVMQLAEQHLQAFSFVGGHVIAPAITAQANPSVDLFAGGVFYLVAAPGLSSAALDMAANLAVALGARPQFIDAREHDGLVAAMLHLPLLANLAILRALGAETGVRDRSQLAAAQPGLLGELPSTESVEELLANADDIVRWLGTCGRELQVLRQALVAGDSEGLREMVERSRDQWQSWLSGPEAEEHIERPRVWRSLFLGNLGRSDRN